MGDTDEQTLIVPQLPSAHVFQRSAVGRPDVFHLASNCFHAPILAESAWDGDRNLRSVLRLGKRRAPMASDDLGVGSM